MGLPSEARIPKLWDTPVLVISGMFTDSVCSYLPYHGPREPVLVPGSCTDPYHFTIRPDGPGHGSRSRPGFTSRDFRDPGACLRHHTLRCACILVGYSGYIYVLFLMGKSTI